MTITTATTIACDQPGCENHITAPTVGAAISRRITDGWTFRYHLDKRVTPTTPGTTNQ